MKPAQPRLDFYEGGRPHPVRFMTTVEDELVGAFDDHLPGFTVPAGRTVTVKVRLALAADAVANEVTANAAVVQRHKDDGDWVGQSGDYRFRVQDEAGTDPDGTSPPGTSSTGTSPTGESSTGPAPTGTASPSRDPRIPFADELARTGLSTKGGILAAVAVFLVVLGAVLIALKPRKPR